MEKFVTRAARLNKAYDIELIERELECGEDDIIVKNHMMGICGSDKSFYRGFMPPQTAEFRQRRSRSFSCSCLRRSSCSRATCFAAAS